MIWKWVAIVLMAGVLVGLTFYYVPDLRKIWRGVESANVVLSDSLKEEQKQQALMNRLLRDATGQLRTLADSFRRGNDRKAALRPIITLQVQGLSGQAQRIEAIEGLIRTNLLRPADTTSRAGMVSYNGAESTALTIDRRLCDSLRVADSLLRGVYYNLQTRYDQRGDSLGSYQTWSLKAGSLANQRGICTGKNKALRALVRKPPY